MATTLDSSCAQGRNGRQGTLRPDMPGHSRPRRQDPVEDGTRVRGLTGTRSCCYPAAGAENIRKISERESRRLEQDKDPVRIDLVRRRIEEHKANPASGVRWEELCDTLLKRRHA